MNTLEILTWLFEATGKRSGRKRLPEGRLRRTARHSPCFVLRALLEHLAITCEICVACEDLFDIAMSSSAVILVFGLDS